MAAQSSIVEFSDGAIAQVARIVEQRQAQRILLVVDEVACAACGADGPLAEAFDSCDVVRFSDFEANPKFDDVIRGVQTARDSNPDLIVALGGGTAIDVGKLIGVLTHQPEDLKCLATGETPIVSDSLPLIAIPTTAGTGSEATHFAVVYVDGRKYSVAHPSILPAYAVVDPQLTHCLPATITAATGLDAFCQAVESLWAVGATDESVAYATEAAELALQHLVDAVHRPRPECRHAMSMASYLAGKAINISKTTAPHALSYPMTSQYGIPHGIAVSLTLGPMLVFNADVTDSDCTDPRGPADVKHRIQTVLSLLGVSNPTDGWKQIMQLVSDVGCPFSLSEAGIRGTEAVEEIVSQVNTERLSNNPRRATSAALTQLLTNAGPTIPKGRNSQ